MYKKFLSVSLFFSTFALSGCFFFDSEIQRWHLAQQGSTSFSLSRDGRFALVSTKLQGIALWDLQQNKKLADFGSQDQYHNSVITSQISDNNRYAITATTQNFAVWDLGWSQAHGLWSIDDAAIQDVAIANNGTEVLLALTNGKALFIDLTDGRRLEFLAHRDKVNSVALSGNGRYALSGGNDHQAYLWDTHSGQIIYSFKHSSRVSQVALQRDGKLAFSTTANNDSIIWDLTTGKKITQLATKLRYQTLSSVRFSDNGQLLVTGTPSRRVELWRTDNGKNIGSWRAEVQPGARPATAVVYDVAISPTGNVVAGSSAGYAQTWSTD
ncbi:hypothetical protein C0Z01_12750 [Photobacterium kishitanii]|uniref:Uncharacterized protein n=1 Tax=Photobacterium kishitanii TaxID=318456 RepID=A0A0B7J962_9GAMM|nr:lipoprotein [Photobacterium kishitanii]OBU19394.1 hypothetical protein AYY22_10750 [Photobacterium kishitanii]OBU34147.1 hypothetical protein AYY23_12175 [Photobacterium kishitanii]PSU22437.1 hypothetical protein CTM84_06710 [Photobacterium kishitanii]PSU91103.1 hypothetical protein C0W42_06185 [Photobacterium kishitanii]PSU95005.1 hypothetical protein C0W35_08200 [Photobacterium kishitanii]